MRGPRILEALAELGIVFRPANVSSAVEDLVAAMLDRGVLVDPVGAVEIAERLGVARSTVDSWRQRPEMSFPLPRRLVGGRPAWDWSDVERWILDRPNTRAANELRAALGAYLADEHERTSS